MTTAKQCGTGVRFEQGGEHTHVRGLVCAIGPEQVEEFLCIHTEGQIVYVCDLFECFGQILEKSTNQ